jgi:hypothetical protein
MGPASSQQNRFALRRTISGKAIVTAIAVTLDRAAKVGRYEFLQTLRLAAGVPFKEHILTWPVCHPQITQARLSIAGIEVPDRRFIDLDVRPSHHLVFNLSVDRLQPLAG